MLDAKTKHAVRKALRHAGWPCAATVDPIHHQINRRGKLPLLLERYANSDGKVACVVEQRDIDYPHGSWREVDVVPAMTSVVIKTLDKQRRDAEWLICAYVDSADGWADHV